MINLVIQYFSSGLVEAVTHTPLKENDTAGPKNLKHRLLTTKFDCAMSKGRLIRRFARNSIKL